MEFDNGMFFVVDVDGICVKQQQNVVYEFIPQIDHREVANGFVLCGVSLLRACHQPFYNFCVYRLQVLYLVKSGTELSTEISMAFDFYRNKYLRPNIRWPNLYGNANHIAYNPFDRFAYLMMMGNAGNYSPSSTTTGEFMCTIGGIC